MTLGKTELFAALYPRLEKQIADAVGAILHDVARLNNLQKTQIDDMENLLVPMRRLLNDHPGFFQERHDSGVNGDAQRRANERTSAPQARNLSPGQGPVGKARHDGPSVHTEADDEVREV
jgi:hypothetical protein